MQHCLWALGPRAERFLTLRAGLGRDRSLGRAAAADRIGLPRTRARGFERRALAGLRKACAGASALASKPRPYVAQNSAAPGTNVMPAALGTAAVRPKAVQDVLAAHRSSGGDQASGGSGRDNAPRGTAGPGVVATGSEPPPGGGLGGVWVAAALAALAALAGASLVRGRLRPQFAAAPMVAPAALPGADPGEQALVGRLFESLTAGDAVGAASLMHPDVRWPDLGRGTLEGRTEFEDYWAARLRHVTVQIEPIRFERRGDELVAEVNEVIRARGDGPAIGEYRAIRRFSFRDGLIAGMKRGYR